MKPTGRGVGTFAQPPSTGEASVASAITVRGFAADGRPVLLELTASTVDAALRVAKQRGIEVAAVEVPRGTQARGLRAGPFPLLLFSQELLALLEAGLNLTEALSTLIAKEGRAAVRGELERILSALREGRNLSDVLSGSPSLFPEVYVATVRASERTGDLPAALGRYIAYQLQFEEIRKKVVSASIYPMALLVVGGLVSLFLLGYVVPRFSVVYDSSGRDIPWLSLLLIDFGRLIYAHWAVLAVLGAGILSATVFALRRPSVRVALAERVLRLPWLAKRVDEFRLARFYRAVSLLLASGIAMPRALPMVTGLLNRAQQGRLASVQLAVQQGQPLSAALVAADLASPVAQSLMRVGERSGRMAEMLERTAKFHDDDFGRWIDWASRLLEPILMILIGVVIGAVVVLMYMPIFELAGSLQ